MSGGWGCPFDDQGQCQKRDVPCDPGEKECVLEDTFRKSVNSSRQRDDATESDEALGERPSSSPGTRARDSAARGVPGREVGSWDPR